MKFPFAPKAALAAFALCLTGTSAFADRCDDSMTTMGIKSCIHLMGVNADGTPTGTSLRRWGIFAFGQWYMAGTRYGGSYTCLGNNQLRADFAPGATPLPGQWLLSATPAPAGWVAPADYQLAGTGTYGPDATGAMTYVAIDAALNPFSKNCR